MRSSTPAHDPAGLGAPVHLVGRRAALRRQGDRGERARLGHAPGLDDADAVTLLEALHQDARHGRAAAHDQAERREVERGLLAVAQQVVPDRRHRGGDRRLLARDQARERRRLEEAPRQHEVGARLPGGVGQAPGVGVEHRDDQEDAVAVVQRVGGAARDRERVQAGRAVAVDDALRVAGGAARVAHGGRRALVDRRPREAGPLGGEQLLVAQHVRSERATRRRRRPRSRARPSSAGRGPWRAAAPASRRR